MYCSDVGGMWTDVCSVGGLNTRTGHVGRLEEDAEKRDKHESYFIFT